MPDPDPTIAASAHPASQRPLTAREMPARRRPLFLWVVLGLFALIALTVGILYLLWCLEPSYWRNNQAFLQSQDNATLNQMADAMEQLILTGLSDPIPPAITGTMPPPSPVDPRVRTVHLSLNEINAWLASNLNAWAANQNISLPPQLSQYMVSTQGDQLILACKVNLPSLSQVVSMSVNLNLLDDGKANVRVAGFWGGCLPLPTQLVARRLRGNPQWVERPAVQHILAAIQGRTFDPVIRLDSTHRIRLLGLKLQPDGMDITLRDEIRRRRVTAIPH